MKKLIIIILTAISLNLSAQSKDSIPKVDSASMPLLSINDIYRYMQPLGGQLTYNQFQQLLQAINYMIATKQKELQSNGKKK